MNQYPYYSSDPSQDQFHLYGVASPAQNDQGEDVQASFQAMNYQSFDPSFPSTAHPFGTQPQSPPESYSNRSISSNSENPYHLHYSASTEGRDELVADPALVRSSSEERMTPAQSKRKAQNRAAQRAFRERKERHVRELEAKVNNLEQESTTLMADNERLKRELARYSTENEILRVTNSVGARGNGPSHLPEPTTTGPQTYSPTDFYSSLVPKGQSSRLHRVMYCKITGERLLDAQATWDLIQNHDLCKRGLVDVADVTQRLKTLVQCDGHGPAFREDQVRKAIEESAASDYDELI